MTKKKELKEELLSKVSGGTGKNNDVYVWYNKHSNSILELYKCQHPEVDGVFLLYWPTVCYSKIAGCNSIQEAKLAIKTNFNIDVDDLN